METVDRFDCIRQQREPEPLITLQERSGGNTITLEAASLLKQYAVSEIDTLLVLDEDCPFEEQLHLVLARDGRILDHIYIGMMYMSGMFALIDSGDRWLRFKFEGDAIWTLRIEAKGRRGLGLLPSVAWRSGGLLSRRYMFLSRGDGE